MKRPADCGRTLREATGLRAGIPVSAAIHDQYASALGTGAVRAGTVMVGTGTAWVLLAVNDRLAAPVIDEAFVCHHVVDGLCGQILSLVNGGSAFTWALHLLGLGEQGCGGDRSSCWSPRSRAARDSASGRSWSPPVCRGSRPARTGRLVGLQLLASTGGCAARGGGRAGLRTRSLPRLPARRGLARGAAGHGWRCGVESGDDPDHGRCDGLAAGVSEHG